MLRARVTLKASYEQVKLESGASPIFPLPPESPLYTPFLGPWMFFPLAFPYTQIPATEKLNSFILPGICPLGYRGSSMSAECWGIRQIWAKSRLCLFLVGQRTTSPSLFSHLQNWDNITNITVLLREWKIRMKSRPSSEPTIYQTFNK